ncbi:MAG: Ig-like domain-containing protein [Planctomycetota bacterium]|nr:Ig-like domain-containing protein [Planctomycetota bacterium]
MDKRILAVTVTCVGLLMCLLGFPSLAGAQAAPLVVSTEPANGASDVAPDVSRIVIKFDQDMVRDSFSVCLADDGDFPPVEGEAAFKDARTFVLGIGKLEPGKTYALRLNSPSKKGFRAAGSIERPLQPFTISFTTAGTSR